MNSDSSDSSRKRSASFEVQVSHATRELHSAFDATVPIPTEFVPRALNRGNAGRTLPVSDFLAPEQGSPIAQERTSELHSNDDAEAPEELERAGEDAAKTRNVPIEELIRRRKQSVAPPANNSSERTSNEPPADALNTQPALDGASRTPRIAKTIALVLTGLLLAGLAIQLVSSSLTSEAKSPKIAASDVQPQAKRRAAASDVQLVKAPSAVSNVAAVNSAEQRAAIDALAANDVAKALELYERLSQANPNSEVYREAVRILREKAGREAQR